LAEAFEKLQLVERAGIGRRRIFETMLGYGKRIPLYEADSHVTLRIFNGSFDERTAALVARWRGEGREIGLDGLLVLTYLKENAFIDTLSAAELLQLPREAARAALDRLAHPETGFLERKGGTRTATFHLAKGVASDLLGKAAYTRTRGIAPIRYAEMVKAFLRDHGSITPKECRELLGLGDSDSARVEVSRYLRIWSSPTGFLRREGTRGPGVRYRLTAG
jgi:ATP-dependent DNA helicase RecG